MKKVAAKAVGNIQKIIKFINKAVKRAKSDIKNFNRNNTDEENVLNSYYFSAYRGKLVLRTNRNRSGSFGILFITRGTGKRDYPEDVVRHEYGHTRQLHELGIVKYTLCIGLPSLFEWGIGEYYSKPWEITADIYGGVRSRIYSKSLIDEGFKYLEKSKSKGIRVWKTIIRK